MRCLIQREHGPSIPGHFQGVNRGIRERQLASITIDMPEEVVDEDIT
jgi:hypothetical protein